MRDTTRFTATGSGSTNITYRITDQGEDDDAKPPIGVRQPTPRPLLPGAVALALPPTTTEDHTP